MTGYCTYSIERTESTHFAPNEDDCDDKDCYQPATALLIVELVDATGFADTYNKVYCEGHLAIATSYLHGTSPLG